MGKIIGVHDSGCTRDGGPNFIVETNLGVGAVFDLVFVCSTAAISPFSRDEIWQRVSIDTVSGSITRNLSNLTPVQAVISVRGAISFTACARTYMASTAGNTAFPSNR